MSVQTRLVHVSCPSMSYDVHVGTGILSEVGAITHDACGGERCCVISETNVAPLYLDRVAGSLSAAGYEVSSLVFEAGERSKNVQTLSWLLEGLAERGLTRDDCVVALGGGVTGDIGGLAAAMYLRGIKVVQVPTSLLAMVDSSVGGKVAIDLSAGKNLAGAFWQPRAVVADVECLHSLSHKLFTDSCGEVIKHAVLADAALLDELLESPLNAGGVTDERLARVVARNVAIKRDVVDADETEHGVRQTLNLGHTIGHGIEAASDFALGHGSSVAAGLCCMARACASLGWTDPALADKICACVAAHGLPTDTDIDHETLMRYMTHDKKRHGDSMNVVVPAQVADAVVRTVSLGELARIVELGCGTKEQQ